MHPMRQLIYDAYRLGPVSITLLMIWASVAYSPWATYHDESWIVDVLFSCLGIALLWHIALIVTERPKAVFVSYTLIHLPAMLAIGFFFGASLTGNWS
jgi:hypothetical protein